MNIFCQDGRLPKHYWRHSKTNRHLLQVQCCEEKSAWCVKGYTKCILKRCERKRGVCLFDIQISYVVPNSILTRFLSRHVNKSNCIDILRSFRRKKKLIKLMKETRCSSDSNSITLQSVGGPHRKHLRVCKLYIMYIMTVKQYNYDTWFECSNSRSTKADSSHIESCFFFTPSIRS